MGVNIKQYHVWDITTFISGLLRTKNGNGRSTVMGPAEWGGGMDEHDTPQTRFDPWLGQEHKKFRRISSHPATWILM